MHIFLSPRQKTPKTLPPKTLPSPASAKLPRKLCQGQSPHRRRSLRHPLDTRPTRPRGPPPGPPPPQPHEWHSLGHVGGAESASLGAAWYAGRCVSFCSDHEQRLWNWQLHRQWNWQRRWQQKQRQVNGQLHGAILRWGCCITPPWPLRPPASKRGWGPPPLYSRRLQESWTGLRGLLNS